MDRSNLSLDIFEYHRKTPFKVGYHDGKLYPVDNGCQSHKGKSFIYGKGYVKLKKPFLAPPLPIEGDLSTLKKTMLSYFDQFGIHVMRYALGIESVNDCVHFRSNRELDCFLEYPEEFFEANLKVEVLNKELLLILKEKWGVALQGRDLELIDDKFKVPFGNYFSKSIELRLCVSIFYFPTRPHIDWIEYEKRLDSFIISFSGRRKSYDCTSLQEELDNQSVREKLRYVAGEEFVGRVEVFNKSEAVNSPPESQLLEPPLAA